MALQPGDRVYRVNRGKKSVMLAVIGRESLSEGAQIVACHIDSPRLDLKPHPIYEDSELCLWQDPLLRRHPQVPVGGDPPAAAGW